jgi:ABC-2 type transport system ATP-binding protein
MENALEVRNLNKSFVVGITKKKQVLHDVTFSILSGTVTGFVGSNGSGKTTTIKSLLRFIFPDSKKTTMSFFKQKELTAIVRQKIGYLPERPYLPEQLTAREFLQYHWSLGGFSKTLNIPFQDKMQEVLKRVDLKGVEDRKLKTFSKGMLQRIGLAQALLGNPEFLILDEPMSGLDPDGRWLVKEIIRSENKRGATVFFSSHLLGDMDELCSQLVVIDQGHIVYSGPAAKFARGSEQVFVLIYFVKGQDIPVTEQIEQNQIAKRMTEIQALGGNILKVNPLHSGVESAFVQLRHKSGEQR